MAAVWTLLAVAGCLGKTQVRTAAPAAPVKPAVSDVLRTSVTATTVELETNQGRLVVGMPRPDALRLRFLRGTGARALPSFAVEPAVLAAPRPLVVEESSSLILIRTAHGLLRIDKQPFALHWMDAAGNRLVEGLARAAWSGDQVELELGLGAGEHVFGLGDKLKGFDRRGQYFELWNTDAYGFKVDTDPLYKSIPFMLAAKPGSARGLFIDHPARARVDVGSARPDRVRYTGASTGSLDVYLLLGDSPRQVVEAYAGLTGTTPLPPLWALGHHQSRYGYLTEADVRGVVTRLQKERVPLDGIWLDIDYQRENAPFTVNTRAFPGLPEMVADFRAAGVRTVVITDLHVKSYQRLPPADYAPYTTGAAGDHFIRDEKGGFFEGPVWPGASVFPEFTLARTRAWWGGLYRDFVAQGIAGFWNDMNEPALFVDSKTFPESVVHRMEDGSTVAHTFIHNAYGSLNARATYEGVRGLLPAERPFVLTRAAYAGVQRYAASWTGDNTADRPHLAATIPQLLNLGLSGYPFNGADVGGFIGCPDPALFAEWMELGALQPFFRNHSAKEACRREPWLFGPAVLERSRRAVERRYRLLPYLYTAFEEASRSGAPVMRPLFFEHPDDAALYGEARAYLLGAELLVAPKLLADAKSYPVTLPKGDWYDVHTLERVTGGERRLASVASDSVRVLARAGAIVPQQGVVTSTRERARGPLLLEVWPGPDCSGSLYVDDGASFAYQQGAFLRVRYACERSDSAFAVSARAEGGYSPWWKQVQLLLRDVSRAPRSVTDADGEPLPSQFDAAKRTLSVTLEGASTEFRVTATF